MLDTSGQPRFKSITTIYNRGSHLALIFFDLSNKGSYEELDTHIKTIRSTPGADVLVVWRLDRLGRSMTHLVSLIETLRTKQVGFRSLCDGAIDTTTASGELVFNIFSSMSQFERRLIQERTQAGLAAARARGRRGGRPRITPEDSKVMAAKRMHRDKMLPIDEICKALKISRPSFYRYLTLGNS